VKKIIAAALLVFSTTAWSHGMYSGYRGYYGTPWMAPALAGAIVGYSLAKPYYYPPAYYQPPVIVQPPVYIQLPSPVGYVQQQILDANCNCYRTVLVPTN